MRFSRIKELPAEKVPNVSSPTNNYHQVRLGGALAGIETLALLSKVSSMKDIGFNMATAEVVASAFSVSAIVTDMMYAYTKSIRELPNYAATDGIKKGADIVRGGYKFRAGSLAAIAGGITAFSDLIKIEKETDPVIQAILFSRSMAGIGSTGTGILITYSYCGPLLNHLAEKQGRSLFVANSYKFLAKGGESTFSTRTAAAHRCVAWLGRSSHHGRRPLLRRLSLDCRLHGDHPVVDPLHISPN